MNQDLPFILNSNTLLVYGFNRSLICDIDKNAFLLIPNTLFFILQDRSVNNIGNVVDKYSDSEESTKEILKYFDFLVENDLLIFTTSSKYFEFFTPNFDYPGIISNAIVDITEIDIKIIELFVSQLEKLLCRSLQLRFYGQFNKIAILDIIKIFDGTLIEWIEILIKEDELINIQEWIQLNINHPRIKLIILYNSKITDLLFQSQINDFKIIQVESNILNDKCCGVVKPHYFTANINAISEAMSFNSCLNRKISIDSMGNIKNCPSMVQSFGNIREVALIDAINMPEFKKYWGTTKDQIKICKDCEFRYICTDCRVYLEDPNDQFSKPLKCGYSPYTNEWSEWSTNPLKQKAIQYYGMEELVAERASSMKDKEPIG